MNNKLLFTITLSSLTIALSGFSGCDEKSPSDFLAKEIKRALGPDVADYQSLTYPTNNFGVATAYTSNVDKSVKVSDKDFLCSTWSCLDIGSSGRPKNEADLMSVRARGIEYAQIGSGAPITMSSEASSKYAFNILLPKIQSMLDLGVGLDHNSVTKVDLTLGKATKRLLSKPDFESFIDGESQTPTHRGLQSRYSQGGLTVVVGDVVIDSIQATVTMSTEMTPKIDAKLAVIPNGVVSDANASFSITKSGAATYTIKTTEPVIALRLLKVQPGAGQLAAGGWDAWKTADDFDPTIGSDNKPKP